MKRTPRILRHILQHVALGAVCMVVSLCVGGQPTLSIHVGIEGKTTPGHFASVRIAVHNYRELGPSILRIRQHIGNAWRGTAEVEHTLPYQIQSDGVFESALPIYDPANPIDVDLVLLDDERVLTSMAVDLRADMAVLPFIVQDRRITRLSEQAAIVDPQTLPTEWWALSGVESLWIASPLDSRAWDSVTRWVTAGGSLVVFTGTDFFRMDSSQLRQLLPIANPHVIAESQARLTGELRDHAIVNLLTPEGSPLMIQWQVGAGHVSLVTLHAQSLDPKLLQSVYAQIPPTKLISLTEATDNLLGQWRVVTLSSLAVLGLCSALIVGTILAVLIGRRSVAGGCAVIGVWVFALAVSAGLISNPKTHSIDVYRVSTSLHLATSLGLSLDYSSFYYQTPENVTWLNGSGPGVPVEILPPSLQGVASRDSRTTAAGTTIQAHSGDTRHWVSYGEATPAISVTRQPGSVIRISNLWIERIERGWLLQDGFMYPLPPVERGVHDYELIRDEELRIATLLAPPNPDRRDLGALSLLKALAEYVPLKQGVWFVALHDRESVTVGEASQKVRDLTLILVQEGVASHEI